MKYLLKLSENKYQEVDGKFKGLEYVHGKQYDKEDIRPEYMSKFEPAESVFPSSEETAVDGSEGIRIGGFMEDEEDETIQSD